MTQRSFDAGNKGVPFALDQSAGWNLFGDDTTLPAAVILRSVIERNSAAMADYCRRNGVSLAPHGKTTMSPELFHLQVRDGAWGITAANVHQARVMKESGVTRVLIANEVTAPGDISWLADHAHMGFHVLCYVDSVAGVRLLNDGIVARSPGARLDVLVELGVPGGRTGARSIAEALQVAHSAADAPALRVVGVSGFEGIIVSTDEATAEQLVDGFLTRLVQLAEIIIDGGLAGDTEQFIVSAGGSVFFDRVVTTLTQMVSARQVRVVIRSGCYLSHDDGVIDDLSPLGSHPRVAGEVFHAALEVWAPVLSRPEPGRIILGAGKRDLSTDSLFPIAKKWVRRGTRSVRNLVDPLRAIKVEDQHTYLDVDPLSEFAVGDFVGLGISHPCTTFDKWRVMLLVDDAYDVADVITTRF